jgi:TfoX/Sxy family transcriptional regulator of competence genes
MAYDEAFAQRIRRAIGDHPGVSEKKMFGGLAFLLGSKMFCGIVGDQLMVRVGPAAYEDALAEPHVRPMDFTGRPLIGYVYVDAAGVRRASALARWVERAMAFVATLPARTTRTPSTGARADGAGILRFTGGDDPR